MVLKLVPVDDKAVDNNNNNLATAVVHVGEGRIESLMDTEAQQNKPGEDTSLELVPSPRMIRNAIFTAFGLILLFILEILWISHIRSTMSNNDQGQSSNYTGGVSRRPYFKDVIQVKTLEKELLPGKKKEGEHARRLVIVGDVHGCKLERKSALTSMCYAEADCVVVALLDKVDFKPWHDHLILVGDMIAKGPSSQGVIDLTRSLRASCVRGNHEDQLLIANAHLLHNSPDCENSTTWGPVSMDEPHAKSDIAFSEQFSRTDIDWIAQCPLILSLGPIPGFSSGNNVVVHAGLAPNVSLDEQDPFEVMNMRSIDEATGLPSELRDKWRPWWYVWNQAQNKLEGCNRTTVIYGHAIHPSHALLLRLQSRVRREVVFQRPSAIE